MTRWLALGALALLALGCGWPPPPDTISISPEFSAGERAQINDALEQWCRAVGFCPTVVESGAEGRIVAKPTPDLGITRVDSSGRPVVALDVDELRERYGNTFWTVAAHEIGHFGAEHTTRGLMRAPFDNPAAALACIDDDAVRLWCAAQGCSFTRGTCQ